MAVQDADWMERAIALAGDAARLGEVPVGAVLVCDGRVLGEGANAALRDSDPSAHAEILALRDAGRGMGNFRLEGATMYVTLEPCAMCAGALLNARIERLVYAVADPRAGAVDSAFNVLRHPACNHRVFIDALPANHPQALRCANLLKVFFRERRS